MTINVACSAGEEVNIYNGILFTPIRTADCLNNLVTITLDLSSQEGFYNYFATVRDIAGNESDYSPRIVIIKRNTASNAPGVPDLVALYDLGSSATDNITSETRPEFTVSCILGSTVTLYNGTNTTPIGTGACMAGTAMITVSPALTAATYSITAKQVIGTGTASTASSALSVTIETAPL